MKTDFENFYGAAAQVIPVLLLAVSIESALVKRIMTLRSNVLGESLYKNAKDSSKGGKDRPFLRLMVDLMSSMLIFHLKYLVVSVISITILIELGVLIALSYDLSDFWVGVLVPMTVIDVAYLMAFTVVAMFLVTQPSKPSRSSGAGSTQPRTMSGQRARTGRAPVDAGEHVEPGPRAPTLRDELSTWP
ncbi:hypothetical protein ACFY36_06730 [Actinoplanes sp. NPDC000266]